MGSADDDNEDEDDFAYDGDVRPITSSYLSRTDSIFFGSGQVQIQCFRRENSDGMQQGL